jgi:uncharacterized protein (DUF58 family)
MRPPAPGGESFRRRRTRRQPPVGYQHGRRALFVHRFPTLHWVYYFLFSHTTIRFYLMGLIGIVPTVFLLLAGFDSPAFLLGYAGVAWMLASLVVGWVCRPRLAVASEMPPRVECGSTFSVRYHVRNTGRRTARSVTVESLIYYDTLQLRLPRPVLGMLAPGGMETLTGEGRALARGRYTLPALRWDSDFPLGFWRWGRTAVPERLLTVYPRYTRLESLDLPLGPLRQNELSASADLTREAFEFAGCREYRDGDSLRHVHPRSSARLGVPVVKEFQTEGRSRTAILVETRGTNRRSLRPLWRKRSPFEAALSITASIVEVLSTTDRVLELLVAGPEVYRFISAGRVGYFEEVLDILAGIEPCRDDPLDKLQPLLFDEIRMIQSVCLVLTRWDERRERLVQELAAWEVGLTVLLITPDGRAPEPLPLEVQCLSARAILRGEVDQIFRN